MQSSTLAACACFLFIASLQPAFAQPEGLAACAEIGAPADRLACYDRLAGRAVEGPAPTGRAGDSDSKLAPKAQLLPPASRPVGGGSGSGSGSGSLVSRYWELEPEDKRGIFNFVGYKPNYVLPLHQTSRINREPRSPTQAAVPLPDYKRTEAKFQLSLRTKVLQDVGFEGGDLWLAFTQQALWQIWNGKDSKPFRNSDYEPEAIYVVPVPEAWRGLPFGWQWRYGQLGIAHQSNGQSDPLSRSWNRASLGAGFERDNWSLSTRLVQRFNEKLETDNNPDLIDYRGRSETQLNWASGLSTASLLYRNTLQGVKYGALQLEWTYPVLRDQPNGLRWYLQAFRGYGETLTDYNFRQTSFGVGVTFLQF
jgi:phospholipase A1